MSPRFPFYLRRSNTRLGEVCSGFSMIELMVVSAIIVVLLALSIPSLSGKRATDLNRAAYEIQGALELARSYAVANHTYTWVGLFEEDSSKASAQPAVSGIGRVVIAVVASRDGTSIFSEAAAETTGSATAATVNLNKDADGTVRLVQVGKLTKLENIHICTPKASTSTFGKRPGSIIEAKDRVGLSDADAALIFRFQYPITGTVQYTFGIRPAPVKSGVAAPSGIVMFNPQGEAISDAGPVPGVAPCKEIAIQASRGTVPDTGANVVAIDINGLTGMATIYRP